MGDRDRLHADQPPTSAFSGSNFPPLLEPGVAPSRTLRFERGSFRHVDRDLPILLVVPVNQRKESCQQYPSASIPLDAKDDSEMPPESFFFG